MQRSESHCLSIAKMRRPEVPRVFSKNSSYCVTVKLMVVFRTRPLLEPLTVMVYVPGAVFSPPESCVFTVSVDVALAAPGVTDAGEKEQLAPLGRFAQLSATGLP